MTRLTRNHVEKSVEEMNDIFGSNFELDYAYGGYTLVSNGRKVITPRQSLGKIAMFINGMMLAPIPQADQIQIKEKDDYIVRSTILLHEILHSGIVDLETQNKISKFLNREKKG